MSDVKNSRLFWISCGVITGAVCLVYFQTVNAGFYFDDWREIVRNPVIQDWKDTSELWYYYKPRFLTYFSFALNFAAGGLDPAGYHAVNIALHILTSILVFGFIHELLSLTSRQSSESASAAVLPALFGALIFALHPVQTQAVTYISQRATVMASLLYIGSLYAYLYGRVHGRSLFFWAAFFLGAAAMFSKQIAFTLPLALTAMDYFFLSPQKKSGLARFLPVLFFWPLLAVIPFLHQIDIGTQTLKQSLAAELIPRETASYGRWEYLLIQIQVIRTYLRMIFLPLGQSLIHVYSAVTSWAEPVLWASLFLLLAVMAAAVGCYRRSRLISFGIVFFFLALAVESSLIPIDQVINEHRLYLPMAGVALIAAALAGILKIGKRMAVVMTVTIIGFLGLLAFKRNTVWANELTLWEDVAAKSGSHPVFMGELAAMYTEHQDFEKALAIYARRPRLNPHELNNIGILYALQGRLDDARASFNEAVRLNPRFAQAYLNLGLIEHKQGNTENAAAFIRKAIEYGPAIAEPYYVLGMIRELSGETDEAVRLYKQAVLKNPAHSRGYERLGLVAARQGKPGQAVIYLEKAVEVNWVNAEHHFNLGVAYGIKRDYPSVQKQIRALSKLRRDDLSGELKALLEKNSPAAGAAAK